MLKQIFSIFCILFLTYPISAQTVQAEFGKNRIQYHEDFKNWWMYETQNFITYWYGKGRNIAHTVVQMAELDNDEIQTILEHRFNDKIEIIVYLDLSDLKQSNLGSEEVFISNSGRTKILGNKMFVYFDGDHQNLRNSIREGIAGVYLESMLYGSNLQEIVQNAVLLNLPDWYKTGLVSYLGSEWNEVIDNELRDILTRKKKYKDFYRLAKDYPRIAGHSMWYFISKYYGRSNISNLLYLTRIHRNLENGFLYVLGTSHERIAEDWSSYFFEKYALDEKNMMSVDDENELPIRNKRNLPISQMKLNPNGEQLAYILNERGKSKMYLYDLASNKKALLFKHGIKNYIQETDYQYPVFNWDSTGTKIALLYEHRDIVHLKEFNLATGEEIEQKLSPEYHRVYGVDYWTADTLILNASTDGFSDLYMYYPNKRSSDRITEDFYDDLEISVAKINDTKGILFSSNRRTTDLRSRKLDTLLPVENFNIFFLEWNKTNPTLRRLTNTPKSNDRQPLLFNQNQIEFLSAQSGIWNKKIITDLTKDDQSGTYTSNYNRNIYNHHGAENGIVKVFSSQFEGDYKLFISAEDVEETVLPFDVTNPEVRKNKSKNSEGTPIVIIEDDADDDKIYEADDKYLFQTEFKRPEGAPKILEKKSKEHQTLRPDTSRKELDFDLLTPIYDDVATTMYDQSKIVEFLNARAVAARLRFKIDYVNTTLDNSLLFGGLDSYAGMKREFQIPPLGILLKANIKDLFEDYIFEGGARFPTTFNGSEYFITFENRKKKLDKKFALYRKVNAETEDTGQLALERNQFVTLIGQYSVKYPLDVYTSLRAIGTLRNDRFIKLATEGNNLNVPIEDEQRAGLKLEIVYDNTINIDINIKNGTRAKAWVELVKKFDLGLFEPGQGLSFNDGFMTVIGVDARHYVRLDRNSIFAARFTASTSLGSERILYYLGGVENQMFSQLNNDVPVPSEQNFAYQTLAAQMRGFQLNARNGSSVALINTELRIPFLKYLSKRKIKSSFLRNLQAVGFADLGTAWHGKSPFSDENPLNSIVVTNPPTVEVEVNYFRNPIVAGYGIGARTLLFGYFLKLDYAWGWETRRVNKPILHFSIGTDF